MLLVRLLTFLIRPQTNTVKKAVELIDAPSKNTFLIPNKYNSKVEIIYLDTHVFFPHSFIE
jgi:hypothetical protein